MAPGDPIVVDDEDMGTATESQVINEVSTGAKGMRL